MTLIDGDKKNSLGNGTPGVESSLATEKVIQSQSSDLNIVLSDIERKEFKEIAKEAIENFIEQSGVDADEIKKQEITEILVAFIVALYNHIATKTNYLPKNKRKIMKALKSFLSEDLESYMLYEGVNEIFKEKNKNKLPGLAQDLFLDIVDDESEIADNGWKMQNFYKLASIIKNMPYPTL